MNVQFFAGIRVATLVACWSFLAWISAMVATAFAGDIDALVLARVPDRPTREPATSLAIENDTICVGYRDAGVQLLDISNPANPRPMAMLSGMGRVNDVALAGGFLYLAARSLIVVDASKPGSPRIVTSLGMDFQLERILISQNRAHVLDAGGHLNIIDVTDPSRPQKIGEYTDPRGIGGMAVDGNLACLGYGYWFTTVDLTDPAHPVTLGGLQLPRLIENVVMQGNHAYASIPDNSDAGSPSGWCVIDISNPRNPVLAGEFFLSDVQSIAIDGSNAYLACNEEGIARYDISNPQSPRFLDRFDTLGQALDVVISKGFMLVADGYAGLQVVGDLPELIPQAPLGVAERIVFSNWKAFVAERSYSAGSAESLGGGLRIYDVSFPSRPRQMGHYAGKFLSFTDVAVTGDLACVAAQIRGVMVLDIRNPTAPTELSSVPGTEGAIAIAASGGLAFAVCERTGEQAPRMAVIDIADPRNPRVVGTWPITGDRRPIDIAVSGTIACVAMELSEVQIIDISNPTQPNIMAVMDGFTSIHCVTIAGTHAYVGTHMLAVIDLSDPAQPRLAGSYPAVARDVQVTDQRALLATLDGDWLIVDVSDPARPRLMGSLRSPSGSAMSVTGTNNYAFSVDWNGQLTSIYLAQPGNPARVAALQIDARGQAIAVSRGIAYVGWRDYDDRSIILVIDVRNPRAPALVRKVTLNGEGDDQRLAVRDDYLYLVQEDGGLQILSIQDPLQPTLVAHVLFPGEELDVAVADHLALVMARDEDRPDYLHLIDITNPTHPTLVASHPLIGPGDTLSVEGHIAYVDPSPFSDLRGQIIDFSDPANPRTLPWWTSRSIPAGVIPGSDGIGYRPSANGIEVLDLRDPGSPRHLGGNTSFSVRGMTLDEKHLYVVTSDGEFLVLDHYQPTRVVVDAVHGPGEVDLEVSGPPGLRVRLQRSADLRRWEYVEDLILSTNRVRLVDLVLPGDSGRRFYRTVSP